MSTSIMITSIRCIESSEPADEVYIKYTIDDDKFTSRYPSSGYFSMKDGSLKEDIGLTLTFNKFAKVELWDEDSALSPDDFLGSHTYYPNEIQPTTVTVSNTNHGGDTYQITTISV